MQWENMTAGRMSLFYRSRRDAREQLLGYCVGGETAFTVLGLHAIMIIKK